MFLARITISTSRHRGATRPVLITTSPTGYGTMTGTTPQASLPGAGATLPSRIQILPVLATPTGCELQPEGRTSTCARLTCLLGLPPMLNIEGFARWRQPLFIGQPKS